MENTASESYIAFISYRHCPLDMQAAIKIQKKIENYTVPKEFREQFGGNKLGHVFRDQDELPSSASLSRSIQDALDRSKFLIVICTPELPKSKWCEEEIRYFLKTHGRDYILAVLVDGTPGESFSPYMLHDFDEEGKPTADYEPLAANIDAPGKKINKKSFDKESTRLIAALIGCPFDSLWQREKRAHMRKMLQAFSVAIAILCVFLGVLLNRNALIGEQNKELQTRLSTAMVDGGFAKLKEHDIKGALKDALAALECDDPDIYDHRVGKLLSDALGPYQYENYECSAVYKQSTEIESFKVSDDTKKILLLDNVGNLRCLDRETYTTLWEVPLIGTNVEIFTEKQGDRVICASEEGLSCLSLTSGEQIWAVPLTDVYSEAFRVMSDDGTLFATMEKNESADKSKIIIINTKDGSKKASVEVISEPECILDEGNLNYSHNNYPAAFSKDNLRFAYAIPFKNDEKEWCQLELLNMETLETKTLGTYEGDIYRFYGMDVNSADDTVFLALNEGLMIVTGLYGRNEEEVQLEKVLHRGASIFKENKYCGLLTNWDRVYLMSENQLYVYNRYRNKVANFYTHDSMTVNAYWADAENGLLEIVTEDGEVVDYIMSSEENTVLKEISSCQSGQSAIKKAFPAGNGSMRDHGSIYTTSSDDPGRLFLLEFKSDPNGKTLLSLERGDDTYRDCCLSDHSNIGLLFFGDKKVETFDKTSGKILQRAEFSDYFWEHDVIFIDDEHFLIGGTLYCMDGTSSQYAEPIEISQRYEIYPSDAIRLNNGQILSIEDDTIYDYKVDDSQLEEKEREGKPHLLYAWLDGVPLEKANDPENAQPVYYGDFLERNLFTLLSENGVILRYGYVMDPVDSYDVNSESGGYFSGELRVRKEKKLWFYDCLSGKAVTVDNPYPSSGEFKAALGHIGKICALGYEDGTFCVYDIGSDSVKEIGNKYSTGEINTICISDDDRYLLLLTSAGRLDVYETGNYDLVFSEWMESLEVYDYNNEMRAKGKEGSEVLLVSLQDSCAIIDMQGQSVLAEYKWNLPKYDKDTDRIYMRENGDGLVLVSYPLYDIPILKEWAEKEVNED